MKYLSKALLAAGLTLGIALSAGQAMAQAKPPTPAAIAAAKEILELKRANTIYANAVPNIVQRTMDTLMQTNLNYQKDLKEVAEVVAKNMAGREKEIGDGMAKIYAQDFTEQELKDLVTFYKTPLGQKLLNEEPKAIASSMQYMNQWAQTFAEEVNGQFRAEMRKRGKAI
ncbi:hypothetical protein IP86_15615 [Rhodopseudomonas sp. AAP120]|jgi:uncharacterized protein|uniref:DUF2059 domain-containing protein n=1 Tax=Rhodopseudomonas sp. AAP120 TaxID=1523430 RepID=UPI0006B94712|nr:DUF2059 domain-containing protein [Rhodopseudomonas sp. AAP120]KPF96717.1 hypothetical protein IP86_15615 [Rhodopseudomonas sp. AAP120]